MAVRRKPAMGRDEQSQASLEFTAYGEPTLSPARRPPAHGGPLAYLWVRDKRDRVASERERRAASATP